MSWSVEFVAKDVPTALAEVAKRSAEGRIPVFVSETLYRAIHALPHPGNAVHVVSEGRVGTDAYSRNSIKISVTQVELFL